jgi:hypothetical protein
MTVRTGVARLLDGGLESLFDEVFPKIQALEDEIAVEAPQGDRAGYF